MKKAPLSRAAPVADCQGVRPGAARTCAAAVAATLHARPAPNGWQACCPAHDDHSPSLSIREGADGRTLLHCHAGCSFEKVVAALALQPRQLFGESEDARRTWQLQRGKVAAAELRDALTAEAERFRVERDIADELLTSELNAIRERVARRYGVTLEPLPTPAWEGGGYGGRARDPLRGACMEHAWRLVWVERVGVVPLSLSVHAQHGLRPAKTPFIAAEDRAARFLRAIDRAASRQAAPQRGT